jgi:ankyrin repeat protein
MQPTRPQAKVNETATPERRTPLSELDQALVSALRAGNMVALRAAIARGANVNLRDEQGRTPIQIARERGDTAALRALEAAGAR